MADLTNPNAVDVSHVHVEDQIFNTDGSPSSTNFPTADEKAALAAATSPSGDNPFATIADVADPGNPNVGSTPDAPIALAPVDWVLSTLSQSVPVHTYDDGTAGVGATITENAATDGALVVDGGTPSPGDRVVFYDGGGSGTGVYVVTAVGDGATVPWVLTRATDCDTVAKRSRYWAVGVSAVHGTKFNGGTVRVTWHDGSGDADLALAGRLGHAESFTTAADFGAHAEGQGTLATGAGAHAEGSYTTASGVGAHAEGDFTHATGPRSHAEGYQSVASGSYGHAEGVTAHAYGYGYSAHSSSSFGQRVHATVSVESTNATPVELTLASGGPLAFLNDDGSPDWEKVAIVRGRILATTPNGDVTSAWDFEGVIVGNAVDTYRWLGGTAPVPSVIAQDAGASAWAVSVALGGNAFAVTVTGQDATAILWLASVDIEEIAAGA